MEDDGINNSTQKNFSIMVGVLIDPPATHTPWASVMIPQHHCKKKLQHMSGFMGSVCAVVCLSLCWVYVSAYRHTLTRTRVHVCVCVCVRVRACVCVCECVSRAFLPTFTQNMFCHLCRALSSCDLCEVNWIAVLLWSTVLNFYQTTGKYCTLWCLLPFTCSTNTKTSCNKNAHIIIHIIDRLCHTNPHQMTIANHHHET